MPSLRCRRLGVPPVHEIAPKKLRSRCSSEQHLGSRTHRLQHFVFLFHQPVAGLQVQTASGWKYVRSEEDSIIVNVADALDFLSGGYLKSTVHRVVRPPPDQADKPRLSLIYFSRQRPRFCSLPSRARCCSASACNLALPMSRKVSQPKVRLL